MKIYLDTNIYIDYLEDRKDRLRPLGEFAFQIIKRAIECEFVVVMFKCWVDAQNCYSAEATAVAKPRPSGRI